MDRINSGELTPQEQAAIMTEVPAPPPNIPQMKLDKLARHRQESFAESQKTAAQKVKHRLTTVAPKGDPSYPKARYHPHKPHIVVRNAQDETQRAPAEQGWVDNPSQFPPSTVRQFSTEEKLAMFDQIAEILEVEEGENPVEILTELRDRMNDFAEEIATRDVAAGVGEQGLPIEDLRAADTKPGLRVLPKKKGK